jgi:hypothetical protein
MTAALLLRIYKHATDVVRQSVGRSVGRLVEEEYEKEEW